MRNPKLDLIADNADIMSAKVIYTGYLNAALSRQGNETNKDLYNSDSIALPQRSRSIPLSSFTNPENMAGNMATVELCEIPALVF